MANGKYFMFGSGDTKKDLETALKTGENTFNSLNECLDYFCEKYPIKKGELSVRYWCYNERLGYDVYIILTERYGKENYIEKYGHPVYIRYLIEL